MYRVTAQRAHATGLSEDKVRRWQEEKARQQEIEASLESFHEGLDLPLMPDEERPLPHLALNEFRHPPLPCVGTTASIEATVMGKNSKGKRAKSAAGVEKRFPRGTGGKDPLDRAGEQKGARVLQGGRADSNRKR